MKRERNKGEDSQLGGGGEKAKERKWRQETEIKVARIDEEEIEVK